MRTSREYQTFNKTMDTILRADPKKVKDEMDAEIRASAKERTAKGERKRGRKSKSGEDAS
ncbi:MAG TPA: hypothetical protein VHX13_09220 [Acidobacteriaceae bacterium]|jgi:hypothetical protein|nr:hypothetical protein [Acidobacteriaceae bacterium]